MAISEVKNKLRKLSSHQITATSGYRKLECFLFPYNYIPDPEIGKICELYDLWDSHRENGKIPSRESFSFSDFSGWHNSMRILKYAEKIGDKYSPIISGELFNRYWGKTTVSQHIHDTEDTSSDLFKKNQEYHRIFNNGFYSICFGQVPLDDRPLASFILLDLPLSKDGKKITHGLQAIMPFKD